MILLLGISITVAAYLLVTDWQAIPYDPCTEYSPFHHPEIVKNHSRNSAPAFVVSSKSLTLFKQNLHPELEVKFGNHKPLPYSGITVTSSLTCRLDSSCPLCKASVPLHQEIHPCLILEANRYGKHNIEKSTNVSTYLRLSCSSNETQLFCININIQGYHHSKESEHYQVQNSEVLTSSQYSIISNSCINAIVPGRHCQWIPFSTITNTVCNDCPPICRAKEQTLNIVQFSMGVFALIFGLPIFWTSLMAIVTDYSPEQSRVCQISYYKMPLLWFILCYSILYRALWLAASPPRTLLHKVSLH